MHKAIGLFSNTVAVQIYTAEGEKSEGQIQIRNLCKHLPCFLTDFFFAFFGAAPCSLLLSNFMINSVRRVFSSVSQSCKVVIWIFSPSAPYCFFADTHWRFICLQIGESRLHKLWNINFAHYAFEFMSMFHLPKRSDLGQTEIRPSPKKVCLKLHLYLFISGSCSCVIVNQFVNTRQSFVNAVMPRNWWKLFGKTVHAFHFGWLCGHASGLHA